MRFGLALLLVFWGAACHVVLGEYSVGEGGSGPVQECTIDADCDTSLNEGCDSGRCAIRCLQDDVCPEYSECWAARFCTEPIGTPCEGTDETSCGGYLCRHVDVDAEPVDGYCPGYCHLPETPCPSGFTCFQLSCYRSP